MTEAADAEEFDFIALGAGLAGMASALTATDLGMRALVIEKTELLGGVTAYSNGQLWAGGTSLQATAGIEDSPSAVLGYLKRLGMGFCDEDMAEAYARLGAQVLDYFAQLIDVRWQLVEGLPDYYYPAFPDALEEGRYVEVEPFRGGDLGEHRARLRVSPHVPYRLTSADMLRFGGGSNAHRWDPALLQEREREDMLASGTGLAAYFVKGLLDAGVPTVTGAEPLELISVDGRVSGVRLRTSAGERTVLARRGVLIATGGYDWNANEMRAFEGQLMIHSAAPPAVAGDHLRLVSGVGAAFTQVAKPVRLGYPAIGETDQGQPLWRIFTSLAFPHAVLVNRRGRRFCDESFYPSVGHAVKVIDGFQQEFVNWPCWVIFDQQYRERYTFGAVPPGGDFPADLGIAEGETLAELARSVGIDPDGLEDEVARFNGFCASGEDLDFSRGERPWSRVWYGDPNSAPNHNLGALSSPPFYAYRPGLVGTGLPTLGLVTDTNARVLDHSRRPIEGLYAAGNSVAIVEAGAGYQSGVANMRSAIFGWAAAMHGGGRAVT
jgi:3-oxosteroid 1-dehydrogenase